MKSGDVRALLIQRGWFTLSGGVTAFIIPITLTGPEQGLFFIFLSIAAIQSIFEAGITSVFFNYTAHEYTVLTASPSRDEPQRNRAHARLLDLVKISRRWFLILSVLFAFLAGTIGFYIIQSAVQREGLAIHWQTPYILLITSISLSIFNLSHIPILEGFGQIADVAKFRLKSVVLSVSVLWIGMATGWGLWALGLSYLLQHSTMAAQLTQAHRRLQLNTISLTTPVVEDSIRWSLEILPVQFRMAVSYFCGYLIAQAVLPFILHTHGSVMAGQIGLMLSIFNALASIIATYMYAAAPKYVEHIANRDVASLTQIFSKVNRNTLLCSLGVYTLLVLSVLGAQHAHLPFMHRIANTQVAIWMAVIGMANAYIGSAATLLRAQKLEPMLPVSIIVALGYLLAMVCFQDARVEHLFMAFALIQVAIAVPITALILYKSDILNFRCGTT